MGVFYYFIKKNLVSKNYSHHQVHDINLFPNKAEIRFPLSLLFDCFPLFHIVLSDKYCNYSKRYYCQPSIFKKHFLI